MVQITYVSSKGDEQTVDAAAGQSLMEVAISNDVDEIDADCGGNCYCGTCRVYIAESWRDRLAPPDSYESDMIDSTEDQTEGVRLSCQIRVTDEIDGIMVRTPPSQR